MTPPVKDMIQPLLDEEELNLRPLDVPFDVEEVARALLAIPCAWRDERLPTLFLMFLDEKSRDERIAWRRAHPDDTLPYVLLVDVQPEHIVVNQFAGDRHAAQSRAFLEWLAGRHRCTVHNEAGVDLSATWPRRG